MAIIIKCNDPKELLAKIRSSIISEPSSLWLVDHDGDITSKQEGLEERAWLRPVVNCRELVFNIISRKYETMRIGIYARYHSDMTLFMLSKFGAEFYDISSTANYACGDVI